MKRRVVLLSVLLAMVLALGAWAEGMDHEGEMVVLPEEDEAVSEVGEISMTDAEGMDCADLIFDNGEADDGAGQDGEIREAVYMEEAGEEERAIAAPELQDEGFEAPVTEDLPEPACIAPYDNSHFEISGTQLIKYTGPGGKVTIPYGVTQIGISAFSDNAAVTQVIIPDTVKTIFHRAFSGCTGLTSVTFQGNVTNIFGEAFYMCSKLTDISIPGGVRTIGSNVFNGCESLARVSIGCVRANMGDHVFFDCKSLADVSITGSVAKAGIGVFASCASLRKIPDGLTVVGDYMYMDCYSLTEVTVPAGVTGIGQGAFANCDKLTGVVFPDGAKSIKDYAFSNCPELSSVTFPASLTEIGQSAFVNCEKLTDVTMETNAAVTIADDAFDGCNKLSTFHIPCASPAYVWAWTHHYNIDYISHRQLVTNAAVAPTCTKEGKTEGKRCLACKTVIAAQTIIPAKGHVEEIIPAKAVTCTADGWTEGRRCTVCGSCTVIPLPIKKTGHSYVTDPAVPVTCTTDGLTEGCHCAVCGAVATPQERIPATGHSLVIDSGVAATCTTGGQTEGSHCAVCGAVIVPQESIPATGHIPEVLSAVEATTTNTGLTEGQICAVCGQILVEQQVTPMLTPPEFRMKKNARNTVMIHEAFQIVVTGKKIKSCKSDNSDVASVTSKGLVTANAGGKAKITIALKGNKKLTLTVTVTDPDAPTKVSISTEGQGTAIQKGSTLLLTAITEPAGANAIFTWSSSDNKVARVDGMGLVEGLRDGTAIITVTTQNGLKSTCKVTVKHFRDSSVHYRALLVAETTFPGTANSNLPSAASANLLAKILKSVKGPCGNGWTVTQRKDRTAGQLRDDIRNAFAGATERDVSLFFINTHGNMSIRITDNYRAAGCLATYPDENGYDGVCLPDLADWLSEVPGKVIVLIDSCGSGAAIYQPKGGDVYDPPTFDQMIIDAFADRDQVIMAPGDPNTGAFVQQGKFYVMTASAYLEYSWHTIGEYGYFAKWLNEGVKTKGSMPADSDADRYLTLNEWYRFVSKKSSKTWIKSKEDGKKYKQHTQVYPANCSLELFYRK